MVLKNRIYDGPSYEDLGLNAPITAPANAPISFERSVPYVTPASDYVAPIYQQPAPTYYPPATQYNAPNYGIGAPTGGGYGGAPIPQPQPKPVISEADWLAGDQDYQNQKNSLNGTLSDFLARLTRQRSEFQQDYDTAMQGLDRNEKQGMLNLGEDFTARGMANSGLFNQARDQAQQGFTNQRNGMNTARTRANSDFDLQQSDKEKSTQSALDNAKNASLARLAAQQMF